MKIFVFSIEINIAKKGFDMICITTGFLRIYRSIAIRAHI